MLVYNVIVLETSLLLGTGIVFGHCIHDDYLYFFIILLNFFDF